MDVLPEMTFSPMVPLFAIAVAMMLFASLVIAGAALLRRLGIEADPPEYYRFQAPTPTPQTGSVDPKAAREQAMQRRTLQPLYDKMESSYGAWAQVIDGLYTLKNSPSASAADPDALTHMSSWQEQADALHQELEATLPTLPALASAGKAERVVEQLHKRMMAVHAEVEAQWLAQGHNAAGQGRLILFAILLGIVLLWAVILFGVI